MTAPIAAADPAGGPSMMDDIRALWRRLTDRFRESNYERHARRELELAGLYDSDADYGAGSIADCVLALCKTLGRQGHSGGSHDMTLEIFGLVANFKRLSPLTTDSREWMNVSEYGTPEGVLGVWKNRRQGTCFSTDGGLTHYDIDEPGWQVRKTLTPAQARLVVNGQNPELAE